MKCHLILNPRSRGGRSASQFDSIFKLMEKAGLEYNYTMAATYDEIRNASVRANRGNDDIIVAVGGDGTINAVINGFFDENGLPGSGKMMGVIYTGTSPDFCRSYGIPLGLEQAVEVIARQHTRLIRIVRMQLKPCPGTEETATRYFSCCASIGIGAMVAAKANQYRKSLGDKTGTLLAILSSLISYRPDEMILKTDQEEIVIRNVTNIFVGRTRYIASGLKVNDGMSDDDDRFYVLSVKDLSLWRLPALLRKLYTGDNVSSSVMSITYANRVTIYAKDKHTAVEADGDPAGFTTCTIRAASSPVKLIVS